MHNGTVEVIKKVGYICDEFLRTYSEDATARVSREAFERSIGDICNVFLKMQADCDERHAKAGLPPHRHLVMYPISMEITQNCFIGVLLNFHTKELLGQRIDKKDALEQMKGMPLNLDDKGKKAFIQEFLLIRPRTMTLAEIETMGIKPFMLINHIKKSTDAALFNHEVENTATQAGGLA